MKNGYVIYPACQAAETLEVALDTAREMSLTERGQVRVENCDTEAVEARFFNGEEL